MSKQLQLIKAAFHNDIKTVTELLKQNVDPNCSEDQDHITPLHFAALNGSLEIAQLLVTAGAKTNAANAAGETPLDIAKLHRHDKLVHLLTVQLSGAGEADGSVNKH